MPPSINYGIEQWVGEAENGEWGCDGIFKSLAETRVVLMVAVHVHCRRDEVGHPSDCKRSGGVKNNFHRFPFARLSFCWHSRFHRIVDLRFPATASWTLCWRSAQGNCRFLFMYLTYIGSAASKIAQIIGSLCSARATCCLFQFADFFQRPIENYAVEDANKDDGYNADDCYRQYVSPT